MIFSKENTYAKVWAIDEKEKYIDVQISTSEKTKDNTYVNSNWFATMLGHAANSLRGKLNAGDKIVITSCKITNECHTAKDGTRKSTPKVLIFEATKDDGGRPASTKSAKETPNDASADDPW